AAQLGAEQQQALLQQAAVLLRVLARVPAVVTADSGCGDFLRGIAAEFPHVASLTVADAHGAALCSSRPEAIGLNFTQFHYFQAALALPSDRPYSLSTVRLSRVDGKPIMLMAVPIYLAAPDAHPLGALVAALRLDWFAGLQDRLSAGDSTVVQVVDSRDGAILARSPDPQGLAGLRFPDHGIIDAFRRSPSGGTVRTDGLDGVQRIFAFAPLRGEGPGLLIAVGLSAQALRQQAAWRMMLAMGFGVGVTGLAVCLSWRVAQRSLVRPLRALSAAAARLGGGDMASEAEISDEAPWEIRALAETFRRMVKRLQARDLRIEAMQRELAESEEHHRLLAEAANDMITRFSSDLRRVYVSPACRDLLGYEQHELVGEKPGAIVHPDDWLELDATLNQALLAGHPTARATYRAFRKDGGQIWLESSGRSLGKGQGFVVVTRDVTNRTMLEQQLAAANHKLSLLASQDGLTGLANRRRFDQALEAEHETLVRDGGRMAVLLLDVDRFKRFNDTYGHPAGDRCLQSIAACIRSALRGPRDLAARYGGEEFAVLLPAAGPSEALEVAHRVRAAIRGAAILHAGSGCGVVTTSIGVAAIEPGEPVEAAELIRRADAALYRAKREGRDQVTLADPQTV
ncbi:MAG TPA: diguanylate cyclase, partial [Acetobacteraceae bacterium]|nr:diguanylate cyclase [Acetobacteraceae bacterium]